MTSEVTQLGRFGHHPDPAIDFCHEVDCCENDAFDLRGEVGIELRGALLLRIERAMSFRVGGDAGAVAAKQNLRALEAAMKSGREREHIEAAIARRRARLTAHDDMQAEILRLREDVARLEMERTLSGEGRSGAGEDGLSAERKAVLQNPRVNDAIQTALERGELTVTMDGYLAALNARQPGEGEREALREALAEAYRKGATDVHSYWVNNPGEPPRGDPEFGESASDYAAAALDIFDSAAALRAAALRATDDAGGA